MSLRLRANAVSEYVRGSLWVLPAASLLVAIGAAMGLSSVRIQPGSPLARFVFGGSAEGARGVLQVVAGSIMTVTSLTFSLTVVALQLASSQYSPRLLRLFLRDRGNQVVLGIFLGTFTYALVVLRGIQGAVGGQPAFVPHLAISVGVLLALASICALVFFIHNLTQTIRVEIILRETRNDIFETITRQSARMPAHAAHEPTIPPPPDAAELLPARRSGYIQQLDPHSLVEAATRLGVVLRLRHAPGAYVLEGSPLAWAWRPPGKNAPIDVEALTKLVAGAVELGDERTMQQDVGFGLKQIVDIALKALSPGINDPSTAVDAFAQLSSVLLRLSEEPLGPRCWRDEDGQARIWVPYPDYAHYVRIACVDIAHYGAGSPSTVRWMLTMLAELGQLVSASRRGPLERALDHILEEALPLLTVPSSRVEVEAFGARARRSLNGELTLDTEFSQ